MNFSFVSRMLIPLRLVQKPYPLVQTPVLAFSADGSKFAMAMAYGGVSVWDVQSKDPLKTFMKVHNYYAFDVRVRYLQFSSANLGKEVLVFVEVRLMFTF